MVRHALACLILMSVVLAACSNRPVPTRRPPSTLTPTVALPTATPLPAETPAWFRQAVVYQIFVRSFYDSNDDGIGDLNGITQKLDYLHNDLGVTTLWLTSIFSAASYDGHDVTDHFAIAPELGAPQDLVTLVGEAHKRDMQVLIDLVAGCTSSQHPFFQDAFRKPDSFYSDWYVWENAAHSAYKSLSADKSDPLLNTDNPVVQKYILEAARYWMDLDNNGNLTDGLDGFVDDARSASPAFWKALRAEVKKENPNFLLLGYTPDKAADQLAPYYEGQFDAMLDVPMYYVLLGNPDKSSGGLLNSQGALSQLADQLQNEAQLYAPWAEPVRFISSYTTNRTASQVKANLAREKQAASLLLTLPGTAMIYYGEEIGMKGSAPGAGPEYDKYRREPMDWYAAESGPGMPTWFKPQNRNNRANDGVSVEEQGGQKDSLLEVYQKMIAQRRLHPALDVGGFQLAATDQCNTCLAYWRWDENDMYLILFNLSNDTQSTTIDFAAVPRPTHGVGEDVLRGGRVSVPSNGRYTLTIEALDIRILHWGKP